MFPQFGATAETLSKASTLVFRIGTDAHLYDDPEDVSIAPLLDSRFDSEKCEALKRLLALIAQGFDVSNFFPQVSHLSLSLSARSCRLVAEKKVREKKFLIHYFRGLKLDLQVVKNVATQSLEVKKLVYLYLLHYAEKYAILMNTVISEPIPSF